MDGIDKNKQYSLECLTYIKQNGKTVQQTLLLLQYD